MKLTEIAMLIFVFIFSGVIIYLGIKANNIVKIPCSIPEINPDYTYFDKEKCRILRGHKL